MTKHVFRVKGSLAEYFNYLSIFSRTQREIDLSDRCDELETDAQYLFHWVEPIGEILLPL